MHSYKRQLIQEFIFRNKLFVSMILIIISVSNFLNVLLPLSLGEFNEWALHDKGTKSRFLTELGLPIHSLAHFYIFFSALVLLKFIFTFLEKYTIGMAGERFSKDIRELLFSKQMYFSFESFNKRPVGKYLLRYSGDLLALQNYISKGILIYIGDLIYFLATMTTLLLINKRLAFIGLFIFLIGFLMIHLLSKKLKLAAILRRNQRSANLGYVTSRLNSFYTIKSMNRENPEIISFTNRSKKLYELGLKYLKLNSLVEALLSVFFFGALLFILYQTTIMRDVKPHQITKNEFLIFLMLFLYAQTAFKRIIKVNTVWRVGNISFDKLIKLIQLPEEKRATATLDMKVLQGNIKVNNIHFSYPNKNAVFNGYYAIFKSNAIHIIKGNVGSGKSTLFKLMQKIYEPQEGELFLDDISYTNYSPFELRKEITMVSSETPLIGNSIFKAISYSTKIEKQEKAIAMLQKLKLKFAEDDQENLQFKIEDGGKNLSSGQRILLQFARAFLTRKSIILLDEPFNYLDQESIKIIVTELNLLKKKRNIIIATSFIPEMLEVDNIVYI